MVRYGNAGQWASTVTGANGPVPGSTTILGNMIVQAEVTPPTRMSAYIPLQPVSIADQFAVLLQQVF